MDTAAVFPQWTPGREVRPTSRTLIACYSLTGHTARLARELAGRTGWDLEEISDVVPRKGRLGRLMNFFDLLFERRPRIRTTGKDPSTYSMVVLATPLWGESLASPMRSYIAEHRRAFKSLALACTTADPGEENAAEHASAEARLSLKATLVLTRSDLKADSGRAKLKTFLDCVQLT